MKLELLKIKDAQEYNENPFQKKINDPIVPKPNRYVSKDKDTINIKEADIEGDVLLTGKRKYLSEGQFAEIFVQEITSIFDLNKATQKLFKYMISKVKYEDLIILNIDECLETIGYKSRGPLFKALAELIQKEFLAKTKNQFVYWINPPLFYQGDRLVIVREYRKVEVPRLEPGEL